MKAFRKDFFREILKNKGRFLSVFFISLLGAAFFSGIRSAEGDMKTSADAYYDQTNYMDLRVLGTLGLTDTDMEDIAKVKGVAQVTGGHTLEVLHKEGEKEQTVKLIALEDGVNEPQILDGRLPQKTDEILVDQKFLDGTGKKIGDQVVFESGTDTALSDDLVHETFTIVGSATLPYYMELTRGTGSIGNGSIDSFGLLLPETFTSEIYTEIYVQVDGAKELESYSTSYEKAVKQVQNRVQELEEEACQRRYDTVYQEGEDKLSDARKQVTDGEKELADGKKTLEDGTLQIEEAKDTVAKKEKELKENESLLAEKETELQNGENQLAAKEKELTAGEQQLQQKMQELAAGKQELATKQTELTDGKAQLQIQEEELNTAKIQLEEQAAKLEEQKSQLEEKEKELDENEVTVTAGITQVQEGQEQLATGMQSVQEEITRLEAQKEQLLQMEEPDAEQLQQIETALQELKQQLTGLETQKEVLSQKETELTGNLTQIQLGKGELEQARTQLDAGEAEISMHRQELAAGEEKIAQAKEQLAAGERQISQAQKQLADGESQIGRAKAQIADGRKQLVGAKATLADGKAQLSAGKQQIVDGKSALREAKDEIAAKETELEDGWKEYRKESRKAEKKLADAKEEIADGEKELEDLKVPDWYVWGRDQVTSTENYGQDAVRITNIGKFFPVIFFLVAALVSLTTMTRMIEEQRQQIGTLKALGYGDGVIAVKYLAYGLMFTISGAFVGVLLGEKILPWVIMNAYGMLYTGMKEYLTPLNWEEGGLAILASALCTGVATVVACYKELAARPAQLMRPEAPKNGKRILLERIPFLWKHLNFTTKSTIRNLIRYKKRFFMTVIGIGGCMGLIVVGFGLQDSITAIAKNQFVNLFTYQASAVFNGDATEEKKAQVQSEMETYPGIQQILEMYCQSVELQSQKRSVDAVMEVPKDLTCFGDFFDLRDRISGKHYDFPAQGAAISEKTADILGLKVGDTVQMKKGDQIVEVEITEIVENYVRHFIYITTDTYQTLFGEAAEYNQLLLRYEDTSDSYEDGLGQTIMEHPEIAAISFTSDLISEIDNMLRSLNIVIVVLIVSAGLLAFVVLYNLNNINITERQRELATLKVLGFYDGEVASYVYRENMVLTVFGILAGVGIGAFLHGKVIRTVEVDMMMFGRRIFFRSFLYSGLITLAFALLVNGMMYYRLKKIDMIESLKSVE